MSDISFDSAHVVVEVAKNEIKKLKEENARLREELNNSMNFHCKYYLTNRSGTVSCHYEEMEREE